jgi:aminopeptidase N
MAQDFHSFSKPNDCVITHANFDLNIKFENQIISGSVTYSIKKKEGAELAFFDTRNLIIEDVVDQKGIQLQFKLLPKEKFLGSALQVSLESGTKEIKIFYKTTSESSALQWLQPEQTRGGKHPFLFTQGQAILSRTWFPVQDSPGIRFTWNAKVKIDSDLLPLMSGKNPTAKNEKGEYFFEMTKPVPAYLIALAAGNLTFKSVGQNTGVYAEPETIDFAAEEFSDMENMLKSAEALYGKYLWDRYDVIVLPPSFPFGGMENPMLTFATPTILAGDKSLTALIAHELAHSWSGNLVTNQTWDDFWLNEGFTVYFERRIMEALYGENYADMLAVLGYQDLIETLKDLGANSNDTKLKLDLKGRDADDGMTDIAYEKGCLLLLQIESMRGREKFDAFVNNYFSTFAFQSISTEDFLLYLEKELALNSNEVSMIKTWVYEPGIPENIIPPTSKLFEDVNETVANFVSGKKNANELKVNDWTSHEWLHFIRQLPNSISINQIEALDQEFKLTNTGNSEIKFAWLMKVIPLGYTKADLAADEFMLSVGRRKFVLPMFKMLYAQERLKEHAKELYKKARPGYHSVTVHSVDEVFTKP